MIYRSNLVAPDLTAHFKHAVLRPTPQSLGHDVLSDWADKPLGDPIFGLYKQCTFLSPDEAAILHHTAKQLGGDWADIGCHTGWTAAHQLMAGCRVSAVDNMLIVKEFRKRLADNLFALPAPRPLQITIFDMTSDEFFGLLDSASLLSGFMIDGNHDEPCPLNDARNALPHLRETGVIVFHDFWGRPIRQGVEYLINQGLECRIYDTPAGMAVCWQGDFSPVEHIPDPAIPWDQIRRSRAPEFDFGVTV